MNFPRVIFILGLMVIAFIEGWILLWGMTLNDKLIIILGAELLIICFFVVAKMDQSKKVKS